MDRLSLLLAIGPQLKSDNFELVRIEVFSIEKQAFLGKKQKIEIKNIKLIFPTIIHEHVVLIYVKLG